MISVSGPNIVEAGSTVCLTVTNVGPGFSATASPSGDPVKLKVVVDPVTHSATVCFVAPSSGAGVTIHVADNAGPEGSTHTVVSRL